MGQVKARGLVPSTPFLESAGARGLVPWPSLSAAEASHEADIAVGVLTPSQTPADRQPHTTDGSAYLSISIGVIIPAYGRAVELDAALASVLTQTRLPDRIVVVDDGSEPPLSLAHLGASADRVTLLRLAENCGAAAARQAALDLLDTSHIAFLDSDDTWCAEKLERQQRYLDETGADETVAVACGWHWIGTEGRVVRSLLPRASTELADFCSGCWFCPGSTVLMSRAALQRVGGFDVRLRRLEDLDLFLRFALEGGRLAVAPFVGASIRRGRNAARATVDAAAGLLREKFRAPLSARGDAGLMRRLDAWLAVEEAAAAFNEGHRLRGAERMLRSLALAPRTRLHLGDWWRDAGEDR